MRYLVLTEKFHWFFKDLEEAKYKQKILNKMGIESRLFIDYYKMYIMFGI